MVNGPGYTLTQLEGMIAAGARGAEGDDAAALWDREIKRHYRSDRRALSIALEDEVWDRHSQIGHIIAEMPAPDGANAGSGDFPEGRWRQAISFFNSRAYRRAHDRAICASLRSTPRAWSSHYPRRAPFTFERFGIDAARNRTLCASH